MQKLISPQNNIIVKLHKKFEEKVRCENGVELYKDTTYHPEEHVMLEAEVVSAPRSIIQRADYAGFIELPAAGDIILTRYDVVFDYLEQPDDANPIYKNCFEYLGEEYWMVDVMQIFGVKEKDRCRMLNGYVLCEPTLETRRAPAWLLLPQYLQEVVHKDVLRIRHVGPGPYRAGDIVYCNPTVVQEYRTYDDAFCIVKQSHLQAVSL